MPTRPIKIIGSDTSTGKLVLDDKEHTEVDPGDSILWQISQHSGVDSIISIKEKSSSANIWENPPRKRGANWVGDISSKAPRSAEYVYAIYWKDSQKGQEHEHDPKISIRPS